MGFWFQLWKMRIRNRLIRWICHWTGGSEVKEYQQQPGFGPKRRQRFRRVAILQNAVELILCALGLEVQMIWTLKALGVKHD